MTCHTLYRVLKADFYDSINCCVIHKIMTTLSCAMLPYIWLQIFVRHIFVNFSNTLYITKILESKILVLHVFSVSLFKYFKPVSKSSLPSPNGKLSRTAPSSCIAAANQEVSKLLPAGITEHIPHSLCHWLRADNTARGRPAARLASYRQY